MTTIERSIDVDVPASVAYATWTQFERFPHFMPDVESVEQHDDRRLRWRAKVWGKTEVWDAEIAEQIPDKRISWRSCGGAANAGVVTFHRLSDDQTRVMLQMSYTPETLIEKVGDALGVLGRSIESDLNGFKKFVEQYGDRIEGSTLKIPAKKDAAQQADVRPS